MRTEENLSVNESSKKRNLEIANGSDDQEEALKKRRTDINMKVTMPSDEPLEEFGHRPIDLETIDRIINNTPEDILCKRDGKYLVFENTRAKSKIGPQEYAMRIAADLEFNLIVATNYCYQKQGKKKFANKYGIFPDKESFAYHFFKKVNDTPRYFELLRGPVNLYVDLDAKGESMLNLEGEILKEENVISEFESAYTECMQILGLESTARWKWSKSSNEGKLSLHGVAKSNSFYWKDNHIDLLNFIRILVDHIKQKKRSYPNLFHHQECVIDTSVYSKNRVMRTLFSSKANENRPLMPLSCTNQHDDEEWMKDPTLFMKEFVDYMIGLEPSEIQGKEPFPLPRGDPIVRARQQRPQEIKTSAVSCRSPFPDKALYHWVPDPANVKEIINNHTAFKGKMEVYKNEGASYYMKNIGAFRECLISPNCTHKSNNGYVIVTETGLTFQCLSSKCHKGQDGKVQSHLFHRFERYSRNNDDEEQVLEEMELFLDDDPVAGKHDECAEKYSFFKFMKMDGQGNFINGDHYEEKVMRQIPVENLSDRGNTIFVKAPMAAGKTSKLLKPLIQDLETDFLKKGRDLRIVSITSRKTLSSDQGQKLDGFSIYFDSTGSLRDDRTIIQLESLGRYDMKKGAPQLLILDEVISIFEQINGSRKDKCPMMRASWERFVWLLKHSLHVIALDANLNDRLIQLFKRFRFEESKGFLYYQNTFKRDHDVKVYTCEDKTMIISLIRQSVESREKIVICTNWLKEAKSLHKLISEESSVRVGIYSSETPEEIKKEHFNDVNNYWLEYDVLIYTPTVSVGVSFELPHYDKIYAIFIDRSTSAESSIQMLKRVRDISSKEVYICFHKCRSDESLNDHFQLPTSDADIESFLSHSVSTATQAFSYNAEFLHRELSEDGHQYRSVTKDEFYYTTIYNIAQSNQSAIAFKKELLALAKYNQGWSSVKQMGDQFLTQRGISKEAMQADKKALFAISKKVKAEDCEAIANAVSYSDYDASLVQEKKSQGISLTMEEKTALRKYQGRKLYKLPDSQNITSDWVAAYYPWHVTTAFRNQSIVFQHGESPHLVLEYLQTLEKNRSLDQEKSCYDVLKARHEFDRFRYVLVFLKEIGFSHLWDSRNFLLDEGKTFTKIESLTLEQNLRQTLKSFLNEKRQSEENSIFVERSESLPLPPLLSNKEIGFYFQREASTTVMTHGNNDSDDEDKIYRDNVMYLMSLFKLQNQGIKKKNIEEWTFKELLGMFNTMLGSTFGIKVEPLRKKSTKYVLSHNHRFKNSKYAPSDESIKSSKILFENWPSLS